jgi:hypothetical protein
MNFFLCSDTGAGLGLGLRLRQEGHSVIANIRNKRLSSAYDGLLPKSNKLAVSPGTIFLFDSPGGGKTAERLRGQGHAVLGGSMFADQIETDPELRRGLMEEVEIKEWIEKPEGLEIATGGWFDGNQFASPLYHRLSANRLMNGDLGAACEAGSCVWACTTPSCRLAYEGLLKIEPLLRHHGYRGSLELESLLNTYGVYGLDWRTRLGGEAFPTVIEGFTEGLGEMLARYARGEAAPLFPLRPAGYAVSIRVSIPPYPYPTDAPAGAAIGELVRADRVHAYFYDVWFDQDNVLKSTGGRGAIADFTGYGDTIFDAALGAKEIADRVQIFDKQYRTDLAEVFGSRHRQYQDLTMPPPQIEAVVPPPPEIAPQLSREALANGMTGHSL